MKALRAGGSAQPSQADPQQLLPILAAGLLPGTFLALAAGAVSSWEGWQSLAGGPAEEQSRSTTRLLS